MGWIGEMSVPITSASGNSSAKSLKQSVQFVGWNIYKSKLTWPRDLACGLLVNVI